MNLKMLILFLAGHLNYLRNGWQKTQGFDPFVEWNLSNLKLWGFRAYMGLTTCLAVAGAYLVLHGVGQAHHLNENLILGLQMTLPPLLFPACLWHWHSYEKLARPGLFKSARFFDDLRLISARLSRDSENPLNSLIDKRYEQHPGVCALGVMEKVRTLIAFAVRAEANIGQLKKKSDERLRQEIYLWEASERNYKNAAKELFEAGKRVGIIPEPTTLQILYATAKLSLGNTNEVIAQA